MDIKVTHENGYTGILYGEHSLVVLKNNQEVLHTGSRLINTKEELYNYLGDIPNFLKQLDESFDKLIEDDEGEGNL